MVSIKPSDADVSSVGDDGGLPAIIRRLRRIDPPAGKATILAQDAIAALPSPIVIVGDPGAGKSVLMETLGKAPGSTFVRASKLVRMHDPSTTLGNATRLVIDGVDEVASNVEGGGIDAVLTKLSMLDFPDFVLSCRAVDWRGAADRIKIRDDYDQDAILLALTPFDLNDARLYLKTRFPSLDAEAILRHLIERGLDDIYGNPLTLRLLGEIAEDGTDLPQSRGELLAMACPKLLLEDNDRHKAASHAIRDQDELLLAAGAACAALLLCDRLAVFTGTESDRPASAFPMASLASLPFATAMDDALKTRLFKSDGENLLAPVHRMVAEYLAAKWLARCVSVGKSSRRVLALLRQNGSVPTSLRALNAWLAGFSPELASRCVTDDPFGVLRYGDTEGLSIADARVLLRALAALSREDPFFRAEDWSRQSAKGLARLELRAELLELLAAPGDHQALGSLLIEAMQGTPLGAELAHQLRVIVEDPARIYAQRNSAFKALAAQGAIGDYAALVETLGMLGDDASLRIAVSAALSDGLGHVPPDRAVPLILNRYGFTLTQTDKALRRQSLATLHASDELLDLPAAELDQWLDALSVHAGPFVKPNSRNRGALVDFGLKILARRLSVAPPPDAGQIARWVGWHRQSHGYDRKPAKAIRAHFEAARDLRRAVQAALFLTGSDADLIRVSQRVGDQALGLYPDEGDLAALIMAWSARASTTPTDNEIWRTLVWLGRTKEGLPDAIRAAARATAGGDAARLEAIAQFDRPVEPHHDPEGDAWRAAREAESEAAFASHRAHIASNLADVDAGSAMLGEAAQAYFGHFHDVNDLADTPRDRMHAYLTPALAERVCNGFVASLSRTDLPAPGAIAEIHTRKREFTIEAVMLAGIMEMVRKGQPLTSVPRKALESAYMVWRRDPESNGSDERGIEDAIAPLVLDTPDAVERFYRTSIEPQLAADVEHVYDLYRLTHSSEFVSLAGRLCREWLQRFPSLRAITTAEMVPAVLQSDDLAPLRQMVIANQTVQRNDPEAVKLWLSLDFLADFATRETVLRAAAARDPDLLWSLRSVIHPATGSRIGTLSSAQLGFVVSVFAPHWPFADRPSGVTSGDTNGFDATEFLRECIAALTASPLADAGAMLRSLTTSVVLGYENSLKHAVAQQRRVQADHDYQAAELDTLRAAVSGELPKTIDDLRAYFADKVEQVRAELLGNALDSWVVYWNRERPHIENDCRNRLIEQLSRALPEGMKFSPEEQMPGVTRADIALHFGKLALPVEIKGQWHDQVWAAASEQLDAQYTKDWRAEGRGAYLVLWFGDVVGHNLPPHPDGADMPSTPDALRAMLVERIPVERRAAIDVYVLDVSGTPEGRRRLAVGRTRKRASKDARSKGTIKR